MAKDAEYKADATDGDGDGLVQDGTIWEREEGTQHEAFKADAKDGDNDGLVQDGTPFERPIEEAVVEEVVEEKKPAAKKTAAKGKKSEPKSTPTVLGSDITVSPSKMIHKNMFEHNSRSVGVTQIRLMELGYPEAGADKRGYLGDSTLLAMNLFAEDHGFEADKIANPDLIRAIFAGTPVTVGV